MSGSGISWAICKSAPRSRQTTMPAPHHITHTLKGPLCGTIRVSRYEKGKTNLDFTEARDSEWQWHQLGHMQVCTSLQTDNHTSTTPLSFLQAECPSCRPTNSVKALKAGTPPTSPHQHYTYQLTSSAAPLNPTGDTVPRPQLWPLTLVPGCH